MDIGIITSEKEWDTLRPEWNTLFESSSTASIFLSWEWMRPWWRHFRKPVDSLYILTARENGKLIGLAPLYASTIDLPVFFSLKRLGLIGDISGDSEYLDFIMVDGREDEITAGFLNYLDASGSNWDFVKLCLLPKNSNTLDRVLRYTAKKHYIVDLYDTQCLSINLPESWETYLKDLQPRFRSKLRSLLRNLTNEHNDFVEKCDSREALPALLESLFDLHQKRWQVKSQPGSFALPARRKFYYEMAEGFLDRGWLQFYSLRFENRLVAHEFSFELRGHVYYLQQGFDPNYEKLSVSTALKAHIIQECIANGAHIYDFLGGDDPFKSKWGTTPQYLTHLTFARPSLLCFSYMWVPRLFEHSKDLARSIAPNRALDLTRSIKQWIVGRLPFGKGG